MYLVCFPSCPLTVADPPSSRLPSYSTPIPSCSLIISARVSSLADSWSCGINIIVGTGVNASTDRQYRLLIPQHSYNIIAKYEHRNQTGRRRPQDGGVDILRPLLLPGLSARLPNEDRDRRGQEEGV